MGKCVKSNRHSIPNDPLLKNAEFNFHFQYLIKSDSKEWAKEKLENEEREELMTDVAHFPIIVYYITSVFFEKCCFHSITIYKYSMGRCLFTNFNCIEVETKEAFVTKISKIVIDTWKYREKANCCSSSTQSNDRKQVTVIFFT